MNTTIIGIVLIAIIIGLIIALVVVSRKKQIVNAQEKEKLLQEISLLQNNKKQEEQLIESLQNKSEVLTEIRDNLQTDIHSLDITLAQKTERCNNLSGKEEQIQSKIKQLQKTANNVYDEALKTAQDKFDLEIKDLSENFQKQKNEYEQDYLSTIEEFSNDLNQKINAGRESLEHLTQQLDRMKSIVHAAIEDQKRRESNKEEKEFYQLQISELDLKEIQKIRDILSYMRNERPLCKAIWESYYRTPCNDLINRIIEDKQTTGIYKITNVLNSKVYIGQAMNLSDRIKTHVKAGLGIDTPNSNLYKAMKHDGVENFTFEILEYCSPVDLNDRERNWIEYFDSQTWGYNMTGGGAAAH